MAFDFKKALPFISPALAGLGTKGGRNFLFGKSGRDEQVSRFTPEQEQALSKLLNMGMGQIENPTQGFQPIADRARSRFEQQTIPSIAERFTSMGQGAQRSSDFTGALGSAASGLEESLAALESDYGMKNKMFGSQLAGMGLTPQFETIRTEPSLGMLGSLLETGSLPALLKLLF